MNPTPAADTEAIAAFMCASRQTVRTTPTADISDQERLLRVALVVEEALEFAAAMGVNITTPDGSPVEHKRTIVAINPAQGVDLVEAADAISDIVVVAKGSALTLGIPVDEVTAAVMETNMAKVENPAFREPDGKLLKPAGWVPPTAAIRAILNVNTAA